MYNKLQPCDYESAFDEINKWYESKNLQINLSISYIVFRNKYFW